jgi:hypothetical protein
MVVFRQGHFISEHGFLSKQYGRQSHRVVLFILTYLPFHAIRIAHALPVCVFIAKVVYSNSVGGIELSQSHVCGLE